MEISDRFMYYEATPEGAERKRKVTMMFVELAEKLDEIVPQGREKSLMLTNLEQAAYFAKAGLGRDLETR